MRELRRIAGALTCATLLLGCAVGGSSAPLAQDVGVLDASAGRDAGVFADAGSSDASATPGGDAGLSDASGSPDAGPSSDAFVPAADALAPPVERDGTGCYDFVDSDGDLAVDCDDSDCTAAPVCCVGSSDPVCCTGTSPTLTLDFASCDGAGEAALAMCDPRLALFGAPRPELRDGAVVPLGTERFDSGVVLASRTFDLRAERVVISADVAPGGACPGCLDVIVVGTTLASMQPDDASRVAPIVAIAITESTGEARLVVADTVVETIALADLAALVGGDSGTATTHQLVLEPSGTLVWSASRAFEVILARRTFPLVGLARIAAWGRSTNRGPGSPRPAALERISVTASACDTPASLTRASASVLPDGLDPFWDDIESVRSPSVIAWNEGPAELERAAIVIDDRVHLAEGLGDGRLRAPLDPGDPLNAIVLDAADPALERFTDHFELFFARPSERSIHRAIGPNGHVLTFETTSPLLVPSSPVQAFDGPDYLEAVVAGAERRLLAARRILETGESELVLFDLGGGGAPTMSDAVVRDDDGMGGVPREAIHRNRAEDPGAFDADEVAAPALVHYGGVLRLYYAGRRGTRWAIGLLVSADALHWSHANEGRPILTGSRAGFDALSVRDPEPAVRNGELRLYHSASDGVREVISLAAHPMP